MCASSLQMTRVIAAISEPDTVRRILDHLGLPIGAAVLDERSLSRPHLMIFPIGLGHRCSAETQALRVEYVNRIAMVRDMPARRWWLRRCKR
jgi:hypothetical protein